jgi:hypothetical protein
MTPLHLRMIEDMTIRNMSPLSQAAYVRVVANSIVSPADLTALEVMAPLPAGRWKVCANCMARPWACAAMCERGCNLDRYRCPTPC